MCRKRPRELLLRTPAPKFGSEPQFAISPTVVTSRSSIRRTSLRSILPPRAQLRVLLLRDDRSAGRNRTTGDGQQVRGCSGPTTQRRRCSGGCGQRSAAVPGRRAKHQTKNPCTPGHGSRRNRRSDRAARVVRPIRSTPPPDLRHFRRAPANSTPTRRNPNDPRRRAERDRRIGSPLWTEVSNRCNAVVMRGAKVREARDELHARHRHHHLAWPGPSAGLQR